MGTRALLQYPLVQLNGAERVAGKTRRRDGELHEAKSSIILQPGPAVLTDGVRAL